MVKDRAELGSAKRDLRIDFFRGLALFMIIFDHVPGDPLSRLTYARIGFSDAAEIFVFLSGISCGIVYARILARQGAAGMLSRVGTRALQIYGYYLLASLATILLIVVSRDFIAVPENHQAFIALREDPIGAIRSAIFLVSPPELPGILVLYLELTLFAIPAFLLIAERSIAAALALSASLWLIAQMHPDLLPRLADHSYFNPLAWQFLFCIGMFVGTWYNSNEMSVEMFRKRSWLIAAGMIVSAGLVYQFAHMLAAHGYLELGALSVPDATHAAMKENLSLIRLLHFLSVALLVALCVAPTSSILRWPGADALIKSGRSSLQVFCAGAVLTVIVNLIVAVDSPTAIERLGLDVAAILLIAWIATKAALPRLPSPRRPHRKVRSNAGTGSLTQISSDVR